MSLGLEYIAKLRERKFYERHKRRQERKSFAIRKNAMRNRREELKNERIDREETLA